ncbi:MAG: Periplasmic binding protein [Candidatus Methanoperedenaceae archaeon GB50]|nr:MAG: Periplasmic binding protein [Candidatus Methanoperedenaceae archaeon GB50]
MKKLWLFFIFINLGIAIYGLYGYFNPESKVAKKSEQKPTVGAFTKIQGVSKDTILIGSSLALGGHASFLGTQYLHGALSYIKHINKEGGIHGRKIKIIAYDDGYDPPRCVANTKKLIFEDKVFCLFCYVGTPTTVRIIDLVEKSKIPLLGLFTGADKLRHPFRQYILNVRASYYQEIATMVRYFIEHEGLKKIAVFYQYDAYGLDGLRGAEIALRRYGLKPVATGSYIRGTLDIEKALEEIIRSQAEAVIMVGTYSPCAKFIKEAKKRGYNPIFHNVSFVGADKLLKELGRDGEGVFITQVVPPPTERVLLPACEEYCRLLERYFPEDTPNFVSFEGFINAKILVEALMRAGRELTREGFIKAIESMRMHYLGIGAALNFGPYDHQGLDKVYLTVIKNGKFELIPEKWIYKTATPGVKSREILIGSSLALSGHASFLGTQHLHGALSYIKHINREGRIHGRKIKIIAYDDSYDPPRCVANTKKLIFEDKVFCLFCYVGTPTTVRIIDLVEKLKIPLLGVFTGADKLRHPFRQYIFNVRASYYQEIETMVRYFIEHEGLKKIAVFYQYDAYGLDGLRGAEIALRRYGLKPVATGSYIRGTLDIEKALEEIIRSQAEAVIMVGTYSPCAKFIKETKKRGYNPIFHNLSVVAADKLLKELGRDAEGLFFTQVVPPPTERVLLPACEEYCRLLERYFPEDTPNFVSFEGFINAKILVEALMRAGRELTREGFIKAIESMRMHYLGIGAALNFGPYDHQGLDKVYLTVIKNGKISLKMK